MKISDQIISLKDILGHTHSSFLQTLSNNDYKTAIIEAIQKITRISRVITKSILIPLANDRKYIDLLVPLYTKEKYEILKPESTFLLIYDGTNYKKEEIDLFPEGSASEVITTTKILEKLKGSNRVLQIDKIESDLFVSSGIIRSIEQITNKVIRLSSEKEYNDYKVVLNLDLGERLEYFTADIVSQDTETITVDRFIPDWKVDDRIYLATTIPLILYYTFRAIPTKDYFSNNDTEIPLPEHFVTYINDLAISYIYRMVGTRDPERIVDYGSLVRAGLVKPEETVLRKVREFTSPGEFEPRAYQPYKQYYGR